ncbi:MAG: DUF3108 domain-containing protein [Pyrinomonadaceae bacterium]|nr:DUF3108 domain-containing protein [Pyrinomonadaceae bacterium]
MLILSVSVLAQLAPVVADLPATPFRTGEKITYNVTFGKFKNAAYAETHVVSRGKLGDRDAVELRSKIKTTNVVSAAFYYIDESRTTFASAQNGFPLYVRKTVNEGVLPKITVQNYLTSPTANFDILTMFFQARFFAGTGTFSFFEDDRVYQAVFQNTATELVSTDAGDFETSVSSVTSEYFTEKGIRDLKINFTIDESRVPVLIRFKTDKGDFCAEAASIQNTIPAPVIVPAATPTPVPTPVPTPRPAATPVPFVENLPLSPDLAFQLGELLEFRVTDAGKPIGLVTLHASERKLFSGVDSLQLRAQVTGVDGASSVLGLNDTIIAQVNPESLAPQAIDLKFSGALAVYNQSAVFDQKTGTVAFDGRVSSDIPVGTHSLLSLAYAVRSFNLKPSKDPNNPVNDTRVAVFFMDRAYVFTIRPSNSEIVTVNGEKVTAQMLSISTGNPEFDRYNLKIWLSVDEKRVPLRFSAGTYQGELVSIKNEIVK